MENKCNVDNMCLKRLTRLLDRRGQSFTAYTISKDENIFFYETLIHSIGLTRSHFARFARERFALRAHENFRKKKVCLNRLKML